MPATISGMELVQSLSLSHAGDCFAPLAMTGMHIVIARKLVPEAIPFMRKQQQLYRPHARDCRARYTRSQYSPTARGVRTLRALG